MTDAPELIDEAAIRAFCADLHEAAARACDGIDRPGLLQVCAIHPASDGVKVGGRFRMAMRRKWPTLPLPKPRPGTTFILRGGRLTKMHRGAVVTVQQNLFLPSSSIEILIRPPAASKLMPCRQSSSKPRLATGMIGSC